eukprot:5637788-Amphidinium_carterae.1
MENGGRGPLKDSATRVMGTPPNFPLPGCAGGQCLYFRSSFPLGLLNNQGRAGWGVTAHAACAQQSLHCTFELELRCVSHSCPRLGGSKDHVFWDSVLHSQILLAARASTT